MRVVMPRVVALQWALHETQKLDRRLTTYLRVRAHALRLQPLPLSLTHPSVALWQSLIDFIQNHMHP